jgi:hypothetical protein
MASPLRPARGVPGLPCPSRAVSLSTSMHRQWANCSPIELLGQPATRSLHPPGNKGRNSSGSCMHPQLFSLMKGLDTASGCPGERRCRAGPIKNTHIPNGACQNPPFDHRRGGDRLVAGGRSPESIGPSLQLPEPPAGRTACRGRLQRRRGNRSQGRRRSTKPGRSPSRLRSVPAPRWNLVIARETRLPCGAACPSPRTRPAGTSRPAPRRSPAWLRSRLRGRRHMGRAHPR